MRISLQGLGDTAATPAAGTTPTVSAPPGFTDGLKLWTSPSAAITATGTLLTNPSTAFSSGLMPFTIGVLAVPVGLVLLLTTMGKRGR